MSLATGVQVLTCIEWLDMLAHGCEFGGVGGAVGGLCCMLQHHLLLTSVDRLIIFYTNCSSSSSSSPKTKALVVCTALRCLYCTPERATCAGPRAHARHNLASHPPWNKLQDQTYGSPVMAITPHHSVQG